MESKQQADVPADESGMTRTQLFFKKKSNTALKQNGILVVQAEKQMTIRGSGAKLCVFMPKRRAK